MDFLVLNKLQSKVMSSIGKNNMVTAMPAVSVYTMSSYYSDKL
jgi:hypothetical protein